MPSPAQANPPAQPAAEGERRRIPVDEARRAFLRMVSHELRTPLNSIIGFSEIIGQELCGPVGAPQYKEYAGFIGESGRKMLRLVNQILEIVRLEGQAADLDLGPERLDLAVDEAADLVDDEARARRVSIRVEGVLPMVCADHRALQTVLVNLLANAVQHAPAGDLVLVRAVARRTDSGPVVEIEIEDRGDGADPEDVPRLLRPFEQGDQALTRRSEGAGLGLPIVRLLCAAMEGQLRVRTSRGRGFTAIVTLPAA